MQKTGVEDVYCEIEKVSMAGMLFTEGNRFSVNVEGIFIDDCESSIVRKEMASGTRESEQGLVFIIR